MALATLWENYQTKFLLAASDPVVVHYKPVRTGSSTGFDSFYQEGTDPSDPDGLGSVTSTPPSTVSVSGKTHLDLYGTSIGGGEDIQQLYIGKFPEMDAWFTCLLSLVKTSTDPSPIKTVFHSSDKIVVGKDGKSYEVIAVRTRGLAAAFVVDVIMKVTNK